MKYGLLPLLMAHSHFLYPYLLRHSCEPCVTSTLMTSLFGKKASVFGVRKSADMDTQGPLRAYWLSQTKAKLRLDPGAGARNGQG